ncbi:MAG: T9SS type A sorting domain-containing protein [Candidatus Marinimicrobia bacterium]|nr:T9SS type A sorting domain-containing protein [Candidatus Neomarinimicrobiota bacterium]
MTFAWIGGTPSSTLGVIPPESESEEIWVSAYLGAWNHYAPPGGNWGILPTDAIDWDAFTHLFYFAMNAKPDGSLSPIKKYHNFNPDRLKAIVSAAHASGTPVLFSIGGWGNHTEFSRAILPKNRTKFINNLIDVLKEWDFDGIDLDLEPIKDPDVPYYKKFVAELYSRLQSLETPMRSPPLLTTATNWQPEMHREIHHYFDQINLMTYDYSGPWRGWVSWHNAPLYHGGYKFESTNRYVPSADGEISEFTAAGVPRDKLGIGIDFYGYIWHGVTGPRQDWKQRPVVKPNVPYWLLMEEYFKFRYYRWDDRAKVSYLSIDEGPKQKMFITYDDKRTAREKIRYARKHGIGGVIIWELGGGYRYNQPAGERDQLLQAVKEAFRLGIYLDSTSAQSPVLLQNYPNPFNASTTFEFHLPKRQHVKLFVYDASGRKVRELANQVLPPQRYVFEWNPEDLPSGIYFCHLITGSRKITKKVTLLQ